MVELSFLSPLRLCAIQHINFFLLNISISSKCLPVFITTMDSILGKYNPKKLSEEEFRGKYLPVSSYYHPLLFLTVPLEVF